MIDISNIYVQRFSQQGDLMKIDEIACSPNCEKCEISQTCTICVDNYKILDSKCTPVCEQHCTICTTPNQCDVCESGYYLPIAGKCSPLPITYHEPETLFTYSQNAYVYDSNYISSDTFAVYSKEYSWAEGRFYFMMNLIQNKQVIKRISPQIYNPQHQQVFSYYLDDNLILVFYFSDRILIQRYDQQSTLIFDRQIPWPSNIGLYVQSNTLVEPLQNNQYSFIYLYVNNAVQFDASDRNTVYRAVLDEQLNFISDPEQIQALGWGYLQERNKYSLQILQYSPKEILFIVTKDNISQINCQSTSYSSSNCKIFKIANGNYVQILWPYQDINNYNYRYYYIGQLTISYRILDSNYQVLSSEEKVIENNYLRQNFLKVYSFDDSFTIVLQQFNYIHQEYSQIVAQRFDNSGEKIGSYYFINSLKSFSFVQTHNYENGYIVLWQEADNYNKQNIMYAKQFDQNGVEVPWSNNAKCTPYCDVCINSYYCQTCSANYKLDANYQCQVICPVNCDVCTTPDQCQSCTSGYQVADNQCSKIQCINNCAQCTSEGVCNSCDANYQFNTDKCQPICASNCNTCTTPLECDTCSSGYEINADKKCQQYDYVSVVTQIQTTVGTPIIATFPNGDYIELFFQSGDNAGVYFQLYNKDGVKVGDITKVGGISRRRLLTTTIQQFAADLAINANQFAVLWLDASSGSTLAKLQKFDQQGQSASDIVELGAYPQTDLTNIKLPCQISTTSNNNFLVSYFAQSDDNYSLFVETFDSQLAQKGTVKEIKKVNALSAPSLTADENGIISLTYQSEGYLFVQQLTEDGEAIDSPKAISDTNSLIIRTTNLENGFIVFLWEVKSQSSIQQFSLNFQLISKDLKTKSQISTLGTIQKASLDPDIQSFNQGFITVWKLTDNFYKTSGLQFQIFDSLGQPTTNAIDVQIDGLYPDNPRIQIMNDAQFMITCTAKNIDADGTILGDGIFMQKYNEEGIIIQDQKSLDLCSYQCQSCQSPLVCLKCQYGYNLNSNNQCVMDCGSFCETCDTPLTCKSCKNGYKLKDNLICEETECSKGFIRNPINKLCETTECPDNCDSCQSNLCIACKESYTLSTENTCIQLQITQTDSGQVMYTIIIIILAAALVGTAFCAFAQYSQKKSLLKQRFTQVHPISAVNEGCNTQIIMRE